MGIKMMETEDGFKNLFEENFRELRRNKINTELEALFSNFILYKYKRDKFSRTAFIEKDLNLKKVIIGVREIKFIGNKKRVLITLNKEKLKISKKAIKLLKEGKSKRENEK